MTLLLCAHCLFGADQPVKCGCGKVFCRSCFKHHDGPCTAFAEWSGGISAARPLDPAQLLRALPPRDYQAKCMDSIRDAFVAGSRSVLAVLSTGLGKTVIYSHVAHRWRKGRVLVMAHRDELIRQGADKLAKVTGEQPDVEMADLYADRSELIGGRAKVIVTSVQTMSRRFSRFDPSEFGLLIIDEAHHAVAESYRSVIGHFSQNPALCTLGVTATPDRADEEALGKVFDTVAFEYQLPSAINDGWLVPIQQQFVFVEGLDFSACRTTAGDLNAGDLAKVMEAEEMLHRVVDPVIQLADDQQTLVFASSVAHAERMAEICNRHRTHSAEFICGATNKDIRRNTLQRYSRGEFQYLFNCMIATEGFDEPRIGVVAIARPTKSRALYAQMVGRGTRPLPGVVDGARLQAPDRRRAIAASGKAGVLVLDFVGNSGRHKLISTADILGGDYSDDVVEAARSAAARKSAAGQPADMQQELLDALQRKDEEARRQGASVIGKAQFGTKSIDPFDLFDITPRREPGWHKGRQPTEGQLNALRKFKIDEKTIETLSFCKASQLLDKLCERADQGKCTARQAATLAKHGFSAEASFEEARQILDQLAANGWSRAKVGT